METIPRSRLFDEMVFKSWWVILFFFLCYFTYDQAVQHKALEEKKLLKKLQSLEEKKEKLLVKQEDLKLQITSQKDDSFIELTLMKCIGLVPEGQTKVHFIQIP
ncbi:MAG: hypothetical protein R3E91_06110 [Chlamydiales bacterium]